MAEPLAATASPSSDQSATADPSQRILTEVLKEQAYQDLSDRLKSAEEELRKEKEEKAVILAEKKDLTFANEQLQEASKAAQTSYSSTSSEIKSYKARIELLANEKKELKEDVETLKQKSRSDDDWIRKLREQIESDSRTIRTLDSERGQAVADKDRFEHNHNIINAALETVRAEVKLYSDALINKDAEFAAYRTSHYAELQRLNLSVDSLNVEVSNLKASKAESQRQYDAKVTIIEQLERDKADIQAKLDRHSKSFRDESSKLQAAINNLELRAAEDRESVEEFEKALRESDDQHAIALDELQQIVDDATTARDAAVTRMKEMEEAVEKLSGALTDGSDGGAISATAHVLSEARESGQTIGQIYINSARNGLALTKANEEVDRLQAVLKDVLMEIQAKAPELKQQRKDFEAVKAEAERLVQELNGAQRERNLAETTFKQLTIKNEALEKEGRSLRTQVVELTLQVRTLLREVSVRDDPSLAYEPFDEVDQNREQMSDIDQVITSNLAAFRKVPELLEQNKTLLRVTHEMATRLERLEHPSAYTASESRNNAPDAEADVMAEAQEVIYALKDELEQLKQDLVEVRGQSDIFAKERDMFSRMLVQSRVSGHRNSSSNGQSSSIDGQGDLVDGILDNLQQQFEQHRETFRAQIAGLETRLKESGQSLQSESDRLTSALKSLAHEQKQNESLRDQQATDRTANQNHIATIAQRDASIEQFLEQLKSLSEERDSLKREAASLQTQVNATQGARSIYEQNEAKRAEELRKLADERATLRMQLGNQETLRGQELENLKLRRSELERANEQLERDLAALRAEISKERESHQATQVLVQQNRKQGLQEALTAAQARITELESSVQAATASHAAAIALLEDQLRSTNDQLEAADETLAATKVEAAKSKDIGLKYQRSKKAVDEQLIAVRSDLLAREGELSSLRAELASATTQIEALQTRLAEAREAAPPVATVPAVIAVESTTADSAALQAEILELQAMIAAGPTQRAPTVDVSSQAQQELVAAKEESRQLRGELSSAQELLSRAREEITRLTREYEAQAAATSKELEALRLRVTELEARPAGAPAEASSSAGGAAATDATEEQLRQAREDYTKLKAEFDAFRADQIAKYDRDVSKVNGVNKNLAAALKARPTVDELKQAQQSVEEALAKQRTELEAEHLATVAKLVLPAPASSETPTELVKTEDAEPLRLELEETKKQLSEAKTKLLRVAVVDSQNTRRGAEIEKLKAALKELEEKTGASAPATAPKPQMAIRGAGVSSAGPSTASLPSRPVTDAVKAKPVAAAGPTTVATASPARGRAVARGGAARPRTGRGGAAGAPPGRSGMEMSAVLAAAGYPKPGTPASKPGQNQAAKRRASQTDGAKDGADAKRVKTEDSQAPGP